MNDIFSMYQQFRQNPLQMLSRRFNIPNNVDMNDAPNDQIKQKLQSIANEM